MCPPLLYLCEIERVALAWLNIYFINLIQRIMTAKRFYQSPETEAVLMPLEGIVCNSRPSASGMSVTNPFGSDTTETPWDE